ncbi:MAG TPA: carboxypeptidase regulatory-like domain-containing protein [Pyrinomonadaceae bacterium]|nr:carboxypeptidase regulatory-like domain-containing protein [Pyrinomonadaceae bacterium]
MNSGRERTNFTPTLLFLRFAICFSLIAGTTTAFAQTTGSATLRGTVKDPAGALIPAATVTLINERTRDERRTATNSDGVFSFSALLPGTYTVKVEASAFKTLEQSGVSVEAASSRALEIVMEIGQATETVTITTNVDQVQTETGARENTITAQQIENLSIISRSAVELLRILPGVVSPDATSLEQVGFLAGANSTAQYNVNGMRGEQNNVLIDGARMIDFGANNGTVITANPDMVQEVRVQTSNYAAEHGTSAVQISATTKGGSREFHGSVYDYIRHHRFQANDRSNSINGIGRPKSKYNYPGGNIGGPVILPGTKFNRNRDKLFFFFGFEYYYQRVDEGSSLFNVPTAAQRQGDFSGFNVQVPVGCTVGGVTGADGTANDLAPGGNLAPCRNNLGAALLSLYPQPNFSGPGGQNYVYSVLRPNDRNQTTFRLDYNISDSAKLYVRLAREYEEQGFPRGLWWDSSMFEIPGKLTSNNTGKSVVVNLTNVINPTMTNEVLFAASKLNLYYDYADPDKVTFEGLGLGAADRVGFRGQANSGVCNNCGGIDFAGANPYVPVGIINAWAPSGLATAYGYPIYSPYSSISITDNLTKVYKSHTLKFGAFIEQGNKEQQSNHDTWITLAQWGQQNATGNDFGDLYVGRPIQFQQATDRPADYFRFYNYEFYAQDSWKVRPNITLEAGLRVGYFPQNYERNGLGVLFDPAAYNRNQGIFLNGDRNTPNGFRLAARGEIPKGVLENPGISWMPRLNFAWDIGGRGDWVVRAGAGLFYNRVQGNYDYYSSGQMPNTYSAVVDTPWNNAPGGSGGLSFDNLDQIDPFAFALVNVSSRDLTSNKIPRVANMSLTVERRLPGNNILSVAYVGTQGRHLPQQRSMNIIPLGALSSGVLAPGSANPSDLSIPINRAAVDAGVLRSFRPFPAYNTIGFFQFTGTSSYHSLQTTLSHQSGRNLQYFLTYTFAKALGTVATAESDGAAWADPIDTRGRSWGVLPFDRTHVFNLSYNYHLPKIARGSWSNWLTNGVFNGWQMSGITTFQSGRPIRLRFSGDINSGGQAIAWFGSDAFNVQGQSTGAVTPIYSGNPQIGGGGAVGDRLFDLSALQIPTFPNTGPAQPPFYLKTPSRSNFDVSFFKNFNFSETTKFQFRVGLFNIFNQAYPTLISPTGGLGSSDIYLTLNTVCNRRLNNVPNGTGGTVGNICDPTGGFSYSQETIDNFGKIVNKHGRRIVEFAFKFYF